MTKAQKKQRKIFEDIARDLSKEPFTQVVHIWQVLTDAIIFADAKHLTTVNGYTVPEMIAMRNLLAAYITAVQTIVKEG